MSKADTWMPLHIGDYLADTGHLRTVEHGAYLLLLMQYWRSGPLSDDDGRLASIARLNRKEWAEAAPTIRSMFTLSDGFLHQKRADIERAKAAALTTAKAEAGRRGADKRWQKEIPVNSKAMAEPSISQKQTDAPLPLHLPTEESSLRSDNPLSPKARRMEQSTIIPAWIPSEPWADFIASRKRKGKAPTDQAIRLLVRRLEEFKTKGQDIAAILNNSTMNGWTSLQPIREGRNPPNTSAAWATVMNHINGAPEAPFIDMEPNDELDFAH